MAGTVANPLPLQGINSKGIAQDNSTFIKSLEGLTGAQGSNFLGSGASQAKSGTDAIAPVLSFLTSLVKGDQGDVTQAAQPEIDQITQQFDQIRNLVSLQPRGGGKTSALAEAPFQKSAQIQRTEGGLRANAANELGSLGTTLAGLGLQQEGIGAGLEGEAASIADSRANRALQEGSLWDKIMGGLKLGSGLAETGASIAYLLGGGSGGSQ